MTTTVLHIEDNEDDRIALHEYLSDSAIELRVLSASSMANGLESLRTNSIDLVLADLSLPDSTGVETFVRLHNEAPNVPIVLLTGRNDEEFAVELLSLGAQDYLAKGDVNRSTLLRTLRYAVERKRIETALKTALEDQDRDQQQIKRAEERFRIVVEAAPNAMMMIDSEGRIALINSQTEKLFGYERKMLLGQKVEMLVPERFRTTHLADRSGFFSGAPTARAMGSGRDLFGVRRDGKEVPIEIGLNPIKSAEGVFVLASIIDITDRKMSEDSLRRSLNEKLALLQEVHHRVKNNLQIISSLLAMQASVILDKEIVAKLADSQRRVMSMAMIHEHLYRHDDMSSIDLAEYVRDLAAHLFSSYTQSPNITYRLDLAPTRLSIEQSVPCGLILNELITNAIKYAYPAGKGEIKIRVFAKADCVSMSVSDHGAGMPADFNWETSKSLGMTLVQELTTQLDGTLEIGRPPGSSFTVRFSHRGAT
jgi:two-component system, sensor histidine kinase PdtaS